MHTAVSIQAPAKVNLHLEVLSPRPDGYHDILSLFQAVSLFDEIRMSRVPRRWETVVRGNFPFPADENIVAKAIGAFRTETGIDEGVEAFVRKRIPIGGGMGGGSSDAAAALLALQRLFDVTLQPDRLRALGAQLGSDVCFFLGPPAAVVEGRGERVQHVPPRSGFAIVAAFPGMPIDTTQAYRWLDADRSSPKAAPVLDAAQIRRTYGEEPLEAWGFSNDFDGPVLSRQPALDALRVRLLEEGAAAAHLTGSGSTVIGLFADRRRARGCARRLAAGGTRAETFLPLAINPLL